MPIVRKRLDWDEYFMGIAEAVSKRGDCTRRQVGAVLADGFHRVVSTGYNGTVPGEKGCLEWGSCPRGRHFPVEAAFGEKTCGCGYSGWPCIYAVSPGSSYDTGPGTCTALHAEQNCLLYAFRDVYGMTMYVTEEPCDGCIKLLRGARLARVVTPSSEFIWDLPWFHDNRPASSGRADRAV